MFHRISPVLARAATTLALLSTCAAASAAPVWAQYDPLSGVLDANYTLQVSGSTVAVVYTAQTVTNVGPEGGHLGMYFGWSWVRPSDPGSGGYQTMSFDNVTHRFTTVGGITLEVERTDGPTGQLRPADVLGDTWIGVPWSPGAGYADIALDGAWELPLFDFGFIGAGQTQSYDVTFRFTFADNAAAQAFANLGGFASYAQGVVQVPEPGSAGLVGLAGLALVLVRRARRR